MEVILTEEVKSLGFPGELVDVAPGYARNFLFPQNLAVRASGENREKFERKQVDIEAQKERRLEEAQDLADSLSTISLTLEKSASEEGTLYGSVTPDDIVEALESNGIAGLNPRQVIIDEAIGELGEFSVRIRLVGDLEPEVEVEVVPA